uniref:Alkaline phosphatase n=1 Tax=Aceria tosichella TaxID=561515 RepID=A0A6G1S5K0_9ACAR
MSLYRNRSIDKSTQASQAMHSRMRKPITSERVCYDDASGELYKSNLRASGRKRPGQKSTTTNTTITTKRRRLYLVRRRTESRSSCRRQSMRGLYKLATTTRGAMLLQQLIICVVATYLCHWSPHMAQAQTVAAQSTSGNEQPFVFQHNQQERDSDYWLQSGRSALESALKWQPIEEQAKNLIIFIGDGMSLSTITAARILHGQLNNKSGEEDQLAFEQLNNVALIKTYNIDQQVPDSAATATAILTGVKANFYTLGVNGNVRLNDTKCQKIRDNQVNSILKWAQEAGKSTGIVTNTRITHATPAAGYAHVSNRRWECDTNVPRNLEEPCKDIARQLIEDEPGSKLNVIMGGGRRCFFGQNFIDPGPTGQMGMRQDQRNLIEQWIAQRRANNEMNYAFVNSTSDLKSVKTDKTDYLLGLFSYSHMSYEELRDTSGYGEPSLTEMTETALKILARNPLGYVLLVEGGRIDHAHHENVAGVALRETISLSWAVQAARQLINERDTLIAVTSDHAHALTINGIAPRGNPILGLSRYKENSTQLPYTTLIYGNGPGNQRPRANPTIGPNSTDSPYYVQYAAIHQEEAFHDGSDVAIFASGPFAHLFQGVQEQSYIAHVFAYALCVGDYQWKAHCRRSPSQANNPLRPINSNDLNDGLDGTGPGRLDQTFDASQQLSSFSSGDNSNNNNAALGRSFGHSNAGANNNRNSLWPRSGASSVSDYTGLSLARHWLAWMTTLTMTTLTVAMVMQPSRNYQFSLAPTT